MITPQLYLDRIESFRSRWHAEVLARAEDPASAEAVAFDAAVAAVEGVPEEERPTVRMAWTGLLDRQDPHSVALRRWMTKLGLNPGPVEIIADLVEELRRRLGHAPADSTVRVTVLLASGVAAEFNAEGHIDVLLLHCPGCQAPMKFSPLQGMWAHLAPVCAKWLAASRDPQGEGCASFIAALVRQLNPTHKPPKPPAN